MAVILKCPQCENKYVWKAGNEPPPEFCPNPDCSWEDKRRADDDIVMPFIRSPHMARSDQTYRDIERASEVRAQMAAEAAGVPVSEMSDLKVTNMRDARHPGEVAAIPVTNAVSQQMDFIKSRGGVAGFGVGDTAEYAKAMQAETSQGAVTINGQTVSNIVPRAGMSAMSRVKRLNGTG